MDVNVKINPAYYPYLKDEHRLQIFFGGSSSGKSFFLAQRCILDMLEGKRNYLVVRNVRATIKNTTFNEIKKAIIATTGGKYFAINNSDLTITCTLNNKQIMFAGLDDVEKLKSITPIDGVVTDIWIEEATETAYESYKQLRKRLRGKASVKKRVILSFNPILKTHWIFTEFFGGWVDSKNYYTDDLLTIRKTTYKDNMFLEEDDIAELENETDPYFYDVYTLGNWGVLGKVIFKNWSVEDLSGLKKSADKLKLGLDWGFSDDPTAWIKTYYDRSKKTIYILDELYRCELTNDVLIDILQNEKQIGHTPLPCDSSNPDRIYELCRAGITAFPVAKGAGSIEFGIDWLLRQKIVIDVQCQNFKNEIQQYQWKEDKFGNALRVPVDKNNHLLDALRYAYEDESKELKISAGKRF